MRKYITYRIKEGSYSPEFTATDDVEAKRKIIQVHGPSPSGIALYRICHPTTQTRTKRLKGIQL